MGGLLGAEMASQHVDAEASGRRVFASISAPSCLVYTYASHENHKRQAAAIQLGRVSSSKRAGELGRPKSDLVRRPMRIELRQPKARVARAVMTYLPTCDGDWVNGPKDLSTNPRPHGGLRVNDALSFARYRAAESRISIAATDGMAGRWIRCRRSARRW